MGVLERDVAESWSSRVQPERWQSRAACLGVPLKAFFNEGTTTARSFDGAREICAACPVLADCREMTDRAERGLAQLLVRVRGGETPDRARSAAVRRDLDHPVRQ
jgi:Transcription factor WhiB